MTHEPEKLPFQKLEVYDLAKQLAAGVHHARIRDTELRDQATRAAKSMFLNLSEGLPNRSPAMRRRYFVSSQASLAETAAAPDLATCIHCVSKEHSRHLHTLALRLNQILNKLLR